MDGHIGHAQLGGEQVVGAGGGEGVNDAVGSRYRRPQATQHRDGDGARMGTHHAGLRERVAARALGKGAAELDDIGGQRGEGTAVCGGERGEGRGRGQGDGVTGATQANAQGDAGLHVAPAAVGEERDVHRVPPSHWWIAPVGARLRA